MILIEETDYQERLVEILSEDSALSPISPANNAKIK